MGRKKEPEWDDKEKRSISEIWHERYMTATAHLSPWEKHCLELLRQPIEQAIRKVLSRVTFKSLMNLEEVMEAFVYEELLHFLPKVVEMSKKITEEVKLLLEDLQIPEINPEETI